MSSARSSLCANTYILAIVSYSMHTTIQLRKETVEKLKDFKNHPRQSYDETINELMKQNAVEVLTMEAATDPL
jgi:predicted CopG family antitoxin